MSVFKRWFVLTNLIVLSLVYMFNLGIAEEVYITDVSRISSVIAALFIASLGLTGVLSWRVGCNTRSTSFKDNLLYVGWFLTEAMMVLGLAGTVIGFIVLFDGNFAGVSFDDPETVKEVIVAIASGMGVALYTTIVGIVSSLLLKVLLVNVEVTIDEHKQI